jgi:hypothetical protein
MVQLLAILLIALLITVRELKMLTWLGRRSAAPTNLLTIVTQGSQSLALGLAKALLRSLLSIASHLSIARPQVA